MLFNAYTGDRPAEFVHASKGRASQDPLGEADESSHCTPAEPTEKTYDDESDAGADPEDDGNGLFDDNDLDGSSSWDPSHEHLNVDTGTGSGYCTEQTDDRMSGDKYIPVDGNDPGRSVEQGCDTTEVDEFGEARSALYTIQKYRTATTHH